MKTLPPLVTLTTDFGLTDPYVGQLKGAVLTGCPTATLVDITHAIPAWDILAAALALQTSYHYFPAGTVHLVVVDPGVGGDRSILAAQGEGHYFVCPDNGILSLLLAEEKIQTARRVAWKGVFEAVSATFHGRDIMAPVAATLAQGSALERLGPSVGLSELTRIDVPEVRSFSDRLDGRVLAVDHFGNVRTSIRIDREVFTPAMFPVVEINGRHLAQVATCYSEASPGGLLVLVDSSGFLEIAANQKNAAVLIGCASGDHLRLEFHKK